ncbi:hypothetical protein K469DRAFT_232422 [Zopfia rhizophila CBS 207.26]|uniref:Uncharacterized protein n=1 Tax=Zopfia rhizophila CBS 207.26 TaxID=1314779 RepID=A0A6A6DRZ1_9PEZI|nr:hypothetical protein K469DRAFT_232422 [Zopfia rhizophila CBS 207.26]
MGIAPFGVRSVYLFSRPVAMVYLTVALTAFMSGAHLSGSVGPFPPIIVQCGASWPPYVSPTNK